MYSQYLTQTVNMLERLNLAVVMNKDRSQKKEKKSLKTY